MRRAALIVSLVIVGVVAAVPAVNDAAAVATAGSETRSGTFSVSLTRAGRTIGRFTCQVRVTPYAHGFKIEAAPVGGWLQLPRGRWDVTYAIRARRLPPKSTLGSGPHAQFADGGRVAVVPNTRGSISTDTGTVGPRIACGILAYRDGVTTHAFRRLFATIAWPSFTLIGANVPVDPSLPGGGIG